MAKSKMERLSSMVNGLKCTVMLNGRIRYFVCKEDARGKLYIQPEGKKVTEEECPMGEEIFI